MSIEAIQKRDSSYGDSSNDVPIDSSKPKDPDFSSNTFARAHLPTGLIAAAARATPATIKADVADLKAKVDAISSDLKSPELVQFAGRGVGLYVACVKLNLTVGSLAVDAKKLADGELTALIPLAKGMTELPEKLRDVVTAHREFAKTFPTATPALAKLARDVNAMEGAAAKLAADTAKLTGV